MLQSGKTASGGFSLIEVIITMVLLVIGAVSIMQMFSVGIFADAEIDKSTAALYLAQGKMEEIRDAGSYSHINTFASARTGLTGDYAGFERQVTVSGNPKQVNVTVYWNTKGSEQRINLVSLFADYDY